MQDISDELKSQMLKHREDYKKKVDLTKVREKYIIDDDNAYLNDLSDWIVYYNHKEKELEEKAKKEGRNHGLDYIGLDFYNERNVALKEISKKHLIKKDE